MRKHALLSGVAGILALFAVSADAADFQLHGSGTVGKGVVLPNQAAIETAAGVKLAGMCF